MTIDDPEDAKAMRDAIMMLLSFANDMSKAMDICPLCLIFDAANICAEGEQEGHLHHGPGGLAIKKDFVHPQHKTIV